MMRNRDLLKKDIQRANEISQLHSRDSEATATLLNNPFFPRQPDILYRHCRTERPGCKIRLALWTAALSLPKT